MDSVKNNIKVRLFENFLTDDPNDLTARVVSERTLGIGEIARTAVNRAKAPTTVEALEHNVNIFLREMAFQLMNGFAINTGFFTASAQVRGVFGNRAERFNPQKHAVLFRFNQGETLRRQLPNINVEVLGMGETAIMISHVVDKKTGSVNDLITPGGVLKIRGGRLKIVGDNPEVGVHFEDEAGNSYKVEERDLIVNNPSQLMVQVPALPAGRYQLVIRNQYAVGAMLREPRTTVYERVLTVET